MNIGFVFTNFNNSNYTLDLLYSINNLNLYDSIIHVAIVDNNSNLNEKMLLEEAKKNFSFVDFVFNNENVGYFSGLNIGLKLLYDKGLEYDFIIIGNNDLTFPIDTINSIVENSKLFDNYPVICPDLITLDGIHQNPHVINKISFFREIIYDIYYTNYLFAKVIKILSRLTNSFTDRKDERYFNISQEIYQGYGACYILGPIFIKKIRFLFSPTFLMGEEFFLSFQLKKLNYKLFYLSSVLVNHHDHATTKTIPSYKFWKISRESHKVYRKYVSVFSKIKFKEINF